jgi:hypothetical protein
MLIVAEANLRLFRLAEPQPGSDDELNWKCEELGTLLRQGHDRPSRVQMVKNSGILMVMGVKSPVMETFRFSSVDEAIKKRNKRLKKSTETEKGFIIRDLVRRGDTVKASEEKIKSISAVCEQGIVKVRCYFNVSTCRSNSAFLFSVY